MLKNCAQLVVYLSVRKRPFCHNSSSHYVCDKTLYLSKHSSRQQLRNYLYDALLLVAGYYIHIFMSVRDCSFYTKQQAKPRGMRRGWKMFSMLMMVLLILLFMFVTFSKTQTILTDEEGRYKLQYDHAPESREWTMPMEAMEDITILR